jgi:hypothetical protein
MIGKHGKTKKTTTRDSNSNETRQEDNRSRRTTGRFASPFSPPERTNREQHKTVRRQSYPPTNSINPTQSTMESAAAAPLEELPVVVQVNDEQGKPLAKVKVGDTKEEALQRLSHYGAGGLVSKDKIGLRDADRITADGAPYTFQ